MNNKSCLSALALMATVGLSLSACGGSPSAIATSPNVESMAASTPSPAVTQEAKKSPRGNIIKELAQPAGMTDKDGKPIVNFTINSITPDAPCTGPYPQPSENGHFTVLDVTVETSPELATASYDGGPLSFDINGAMFKFVGASGTTFNGSLNSGGAYSCLPDEQMINNHGGGIGPAEKVTGKLVLDLPETTGTLVFKSYLTSGNGGWEWNF